MPQDNRQFSAQICVKSDTARTRLECSPAPLHGGPEGFLRVRQGRRWLDGFYSPAALGEMVAAFLSGLPREGDAPIGMGKGVYVSVPLPASCLMRTITQISSNEPVRLSDGRWHITCFVYEHGQLFVPCCVCKILTRKEALYARLHQQS